MTQVVPHENLKTEGKLLEYEESMGNAAFVSHQWVDRSHPDLWPFRMRWDVFV